jgi:predicted nucleic acid-binding protein
MRNVLSSIEGRVAIADVVKRESQYVLVGGAGDDALEREAIDLSPMIESGALDVIETDDDEELLTFIDLTRDLDDGEAMTLALAIHRRGVIVTDDRKAMRLSREAGVSLMTSLDLMKHWSESASIPHAELRLVLGDLRERGRFEPSRQHPLRTWWESVFEY